ncbi:PAS domain S-box protein [Hansschlegelia sp.]|uniref:hybrid sensor histidine kinase/response regulator n=1 Tax=Hansschlegelia sp. TaxID=2041892 RepID=UPI002B811D2E|nr:PAS domain S-box protein [Hansschlegelia sp.]HVI28795.1 PAS domain S-box protein [Hansschlegelia sp.]
MTAPHDPSSERVLILAPLGRDARIAQSLMHEAAIASLIVSDLDELLRGLTETAGSVLVTEEALQGADLSGLRGWIADQPPWSDMPFVVLVRHGGGRERNPAATRLSEFLGNVTFVERPFHPTTLISVVRAALRGRRRQYEARARLEALRVERQHYLDLFENIDAGFCTFEMKFDEAGRPVDYRFIETNPAFEAQTGLCNAVGRWMRELAPNHEPHWFEAYGGVAMTGEPIRFESTAKELGQRWFDVHAFRVDKPEQRRVAALFNDITPRRKLELQLRQLNEGLEAQVAERTAERDRVWRNSRDLLIVVGTDGVFRAVNPAWTAILGHPYEDVVGRSFRDFIWPEDLAVTEAALHEASEARDLTNFENRFCHIDGTPRWVSWRTSAEGELIYAYGREITAEKQQAAALVQAEEALRQSQKLEAVGQLTGGVAHDFNNLLTIIRSSVDFLRRPDLPEERRRRYVEAISETTDRAARLTGQLLAFARRQALNPEVFEVSACVSALTDMLDTVTGARVKVVSAFPNRPCFVKADRSQFETAVVNMAVNARDAMNGEGVLTLRVACGTGLPPIRGQAASRKPFVAVSLADTGEGIAPGIISQIFEPFYTTKEIGKGTGLGLSQVFGFAKQSGGDVAVESTPGAGATFTIYLPEVPEAAEPAPKRRLDEPAPVGDGRRVLIVEDNVEVGGFATQTLQDLGYVTSWAMNASEALVMLKDPGARFDVVFSDVVMPGMNGVDLAREIRRLTPELPVVLASGYSDVLAQEGRSGFELLQKPYSVEELSRVLRLAISNSFGSGD